MGDIGSRLSIGGVKLLGHVTKVARGNDFKVKDLREFQEGLKGYLGYDTEQPLDYNYTDYKRRSKEAVINLSTVNFSECFYKEGEEDIDLIKYIKNHVEDGSVCKLYVVEYEQGGDMEITRYRITSKEIIGLDMISGMD